MALPAIIELEQFYPHEPSEVWRALTDPGLHARYWNADHAGPVPGYGFELEMGPWGKLAGAVLESVPGRLLKYRFAAGMLETTITWQLVPEGTGTRLTLTHEGFNVDTPLGRRAFERIKPNWPPTLSRLAALLAVDRWWRETN